MKPLLVWGATGQFKVLFPMIKDHQIVLYDENNKLQSPFPGISIEHSLEVIKEWIQKNQGSGFVVAIGGTRGKERCEIAKFLESNGLYAFKPLLHPRAWVAETASIQSGSQILARATVCEFASIGKQCVINTNASVDHDCKIADGVHIMPGATLAGCVSVDEYASIGSGAVVLPHIRIGKSAIVGAGAVVTKDVPADSIVVGNPARISHSLGSTS